MTPRRSLILLALFPLGAGIGPGVETGNEALECEHFVYSSHLVCVLREACRSSRAIPPAPGRSRRKQDPFDAPSAYETRIGSVVLPPPLRVLEIIDTPFPRRSTRR